MNAENHAVAFQEAMTSFEVCSPRYAVMSARIAEGCYLLTAVERGDKTAEEALAEATTRVRRVLRRLPPFAGVKLAQPRPKLRLVA